MMGKVYLVGAGPGDEGLITVKAINCIKSADVIIYDNLANKNFLQYSKNFVDEIYVGKKINQHTLSQEKINELLIDKAKNNNIVVRLKGGDPFVFGRGGEEALALKEADISFEIVPGVSSSIATLAYAGIPITHRGISSSFHVITGHEDPEKDKEIIDYSILAKLSGTLVFLMGLNNLSKICRALIKNGKSPDTPVAVISKGTLPKQKVVTASLSTIENNIDGIDYPAIIVVGEVVNLREFMNWFEEKPLFDKNVLVTRARHQASVLSQKIIEAGGNAVEFPTIEITPNPNNDAIISMFDSLGSYNWIIFTSVNGVEIFFEKLKNADLDVRKLGKAKLCAIGEATKSAIEDKYLKVEFCPDEYVAESLIDGLKFCINKEDKVLIPRAEEAREILPDELTKIGAHVDVVPLYKTEIPTHSKENLIDILKDIDIITFASSSTVSNFLEILGKENLALLDTIKIACIGPVTANTAKGFGIKIDVMPDNHTIDALVNALTEMEK